MQSIKILTIKLLVFSIIVGGIIYVIQNFIMPSWIHENVWKVLSFFIILTWVTSAFSHYLVSLNKENSVNIILGAVGVRFLASLGFIAIFLFLGVENIILFVVNFFIIYLFYLLFDMYGLITNLRPISK